MRERKKKDTCSVYAEAICLGLSLQTDVQVLYFCNVLRFCEEIKKKKVEIWFLFSSFGFKMLNFKQIFLFVVNIFFFFK